jgi:hypothetical protein
LGEKIGVLTTENRRAEETSLTGIMNQHDKPLPGERRGLFYTQKISKASFCGKYGNPCTPNGESEEKGSWIPPAGDRA